MREDEVARRGFISLVRTYSGGRQDGYSILNDQNFVRRLCIYTDDWEIDEDATIQTFYAMCREGTIFDIEGV